jgi:outer membrane protein insertion porin family
MRSDFNVGVSGFFFNRFYEEWTEDRLGGRLSIGQAINEYWSASVALRLEDVRVRGLPNEPPAPPDVIPEDLRQVEGHNFLSTASFTLSNDTRDNAFIPTQGHFLEGTFEQAFGEFNYSRVEVTGSQFFTLRERADGFGKHILQLFGQMSWTGSDTPIFERYYAGGYSSFRGFAFRGMSPREGDFKVGGNFMALGTVEYMFPLTANDQIRAVAFTDFGTVEEDIGFDDFRASAGFGFRLVIPAMGPAPIAFDFAWPLLREDNDERRVFSFYVGFTR